MARSHDLVIPSDDELGRLSREEKAKLGAAMDGVELVEYGERYIPGSPADKRAERSVVKWFLLSGLFGLLFAVAFIVMPAGYESAYAGSKQVLYALYTPALGVTMGLCVLCFGVGVVALAKKITPHEVAVQQRHIGLSAEVDRQTVGAEVMDTVEKMGMIKRRGMIKGSIALAGGAVGLATVVPLLGGLIKNPWAEGPESELWVTLWRPITNPDKSVTKVRMTYIDGTPVRPEDVSAGSLTTVFPGVPNGAKASDSAVMLFRLRPNAQVKVRAGQDGFNYGDIWAYSKICTHVGCPVSLYEEQTGRILCPCHQSQFDVFDGARPVFGPATRPLPQLHIGVDDEGYLIAESDFIEAVGPGFWENGKRAPFSSHPEGTSS